MLFNNEAGEYFEDEIFGGRVTAIIRENLVLDWKETSEITSVSILFLITLFLLFIILIPCELKKIHRYRFAVKCSLFKRRVHKEHRSSVHNTVLQWIDRSHIAVGSC